MKKLSILIIVILLVSFAAAHQAAQTPSPATPAAATSAAPATSPTATPAVQFKAGSKVFLESMPNDFDKALREAMAKKKVPLTLVDKKEDAQFLIRGTSESVKAATAKKVIMWNWHSNEEASIAVVNLASSEIVFSYNANKQSSAHGQRSTAEACAKHIKEELEKAK
jgi:hypothetical protein